MSKRLKQSGASFRKSKKVKDLAASGEGCSKISEFFLTSGTLLPSIATVDRTLNITAGSPVLELVAPPTDIEHVESPLEPLQLPSLDISSVVPTKFPSHAESPLPLYDVTIECPVPQPIIDERPSSDCCTSSKHQVDESVVQDGVTELNLANACTAGPSTKSIDMIASSSRDFSTANSSKH